MGKNTEKGTCPIKCVFLREIFGIRNLIKPLVFNLKYTLQEHLFLYFPM